MIPVCYRHDCKPSTGGHLEVLLLTNLEGDTWETLIKPAKRAKVGTEISFGDGRLKAIVEKELPHGGRVIRFMQGVLSRLKRLSIPCETK